MSPSKGRICVVRHGYFPSDPRVRKAVTALLDDGFEVDVVCLRQEGESRRDVWRGATISRLAGPRRRGGLLRYLSEYFGFFIRAAALIGARTMRRRYDVIQVHTMPDFLAFVAVVPKLFGSKLLLDFHELMPEFFAAKFSKGMTSPPVRAISMVERLAARLADEILVVSPIHKETVEQRLGKALTIVPNVPDTGVFPTVSTLDPTSRGEDVPLVFTHGTLVEAYGIQVLIEAIGHANEKRRVHLNVVGEGEYGDELRRLTRELGLSEEVRFVGRVPLEQVVDEINKADIGVVAFIADGYMEYGVPNKLFEYVALGLPVIASDMPGIRSYFDERHITFFDAGDTKDLATKILDLIDDPQRRADMVRAAADVYERVRWDRTKHDYLAVVDRLVRRNGRARQDRSRGSSVAFISNALQEPVDEGIRKCAHELAQRLGESGAPIVAVKDDERWWSRKLMLGMKFFRLRKRADIILYLPSQSATLGTAMRAAVLRLSTRSPVALLSLQPTRLERLNMIPRALWPKVLLSPSPSAVTAATANGLRAEFVPMGVDADRFRPADGETRAALRRRFGFGDQKIVLHVGHARSSRGLDWMLDIRRVTGGLPVAVFGASRGRDESVIERLRAGGVMVIDSYVPRIEELYKAVDCYVFGVQDELSAIGVPLSVLEAMACNIAVVSSPFGGLPRMLQPGGGLTFVDDSADVVTAVASSLAIAPEDIATRDKVLPYSWDAVATTIVDGAKRIA